GIVTVLPALSGADRHRAAALGAVADPGQQRRAAGDTCRCDFRVTLAQQRLHLVEGFTVNERGDRYRDDLGSRLQFLRLGALVELMLADIGAPGQDTVELADAPTPAVARVDAAFVEIVHDRLHAHRAAVAVSLRCQPEDQTYGV